MASSSKDVPSPIDLRRADHAAEWAAEAMTKRPQRTRFFEAMAGELRALGAEHVLELGSGPGFLARHLTQSIPRLRLTMLDFSAAMHDLARERLGTLAERAAFIESDFLDWSWAHDLGKFDAVVTMQAVHELRHKSRAPELHSAVLSLLGATGIYLVCDHYVGDDGMQNAELFMTPDEHVAALRSAGFSHVEQLLKDRGLVLHRASRT